MHIQIYVRSQSALAEDFREMLNDAGASRWTDTQVYAAINRAITAWGSRVRVPRYLTISGVGPGTYEYALPDYVEMPIDVQMKRLGRSLSYVQGEAEELWDTIDSWTVYPTPAGSRVLRFQFSPQDVDTRITWWAQNGKLPTTIPNLDAAITAADTDLTIDTTLPDIHLSGFVRIDREWLSYAGVTFGAATTTLNNLQRGLLGTTADAHDESDTVQWGVAVHSNKLYDQLEYQTATNLFMMLRSIVSGQESTRHFENARLYQQKADEFWRTYMPPRPPRWKGSREAYAPGSRAVEYTAGS